MFVTCTGSRIGDRGIESGKSRKYKLTTAPGMDEPQPMKIYIDTPPPKQSFTKTFTFR